MILTTVRSQNPKTPATKYEIKVSEGGQLYCSCPAWKFAKIERQGAVELKQPCKHLKLLGVTKPHRMEIPSFIFIRR